MKISRKHLILLLIIVEIAMVLGAVLPSRGAEKLNVWKIGDYQEPLHQGDTINITYTLVNEHVEPLLNVTLQETVPKGKLRVLQTAESNNRSLLYNATSINASWSRLDPGEQITYWVVYNVTAFPGTIVVLTPTNITYFLVQGLKESVKSNSISFLVAKLNVTTTTATTTTKLKTLGTEPVPDYLVVLMYALPLLVMFPTYLAWKLLRRA